MQTKLAQFTDQKLTSTITLFLCCSLFILNFFFAIPLLLKPMCSETDAYGRASVYPVTQSGLFTMYGGVWLPLYQTFVSLTQFLPGTEAMMPRIVTQLVANFVPVFIFLLTRMLTKRNGSSFMAAVLCILFPLFQEIGAATLTETFFLTLFLGSLYYLLNDNYVQFGWLFLLSQMTRFESWFVVPWLIPIIILLKKPAPITKFILIALCVAFPIFYSALSYFTHDTGFSYAVEMNEMANRVAIEGRNNFPLSLSRWTEKFWEVVPVGYVGLFLIGLFAFIQQQEKNKTATYLEQFVFALLPLFLLFMLPVQLFLPFRDWLPTRYILIPTVLLFPLIGMGIQLLITKFSWRQFWQWYLLGALFICFELYSLRLNTNDLVATYNTPQFAELYETLNYQVKNILLKQPNTVIYVYNPLVEKIDVPNIDAELVKYFLLPYHPEVVYVPEGELSALLDNTTRKKIVISKSGLQLSDRPILRKLFSGQYYDFSSTENSF